MLLRRKENRKQKQKRRATEARYASQFSTYGLPAMLAVAAVIVALFLYLTSGEDYVGERHD